MELKPCPFCGSVDVICVDHIAKLRHRKNCFLGPSTMFNNVTRPQEPARWNTRHNPLESEVAELREALEVCREALRENLSMFAYKNEQVMLSAFNCAGQALSRAKGE